jgi:hypothetical protein
VRHGKSFEIQKEIERVIDRERERDQRVEEKSVEAKTSGIGHRSREIGRKASYRRTKIKCALKVFLAVITVGYLL